MRGGAKNLLAIGLSAIQINAPSNQECFKKDKFFKCRFEKVNFLSVDIPATSCPLKRNPPRSPYELNLIMSVRDLFRKEHLALPEKKGDPIQL